MGIRETSNVTFLGWERKPENYKRPSNKVVHLQDKPGISAPVLPEEKIEMVPVEKQKKARKSKEETLESTLAKLEEGEFSGFSNFDFYTVTREISQIALPYVGNDCIGLLTFINDKILGFNKAFDCISASQFKLNLKISKNKILLLIDIAERKEVIFTYMNGRQGEQKKYYFLNTVVFRKIVKALNKGLLDFSEIKSIEKQFSKERTKITIITENDPTKRKDLLFNDWRNRMYKAYENIANRFEEKDGQIFLQISKSNRPSSENEQVQCTDQTRPVPKSNTHLDNSTVDNFLKETSTNSEDKNQTDNDKNVDVDSLKISKNNKNQTEVGMSGNNISTKPEKTESQSKTDKNTQKVPGGQGVPEEPEHSVDNLEPNVDKEKEVIKQLTALNIDSGIAKGYVTKHGLENVIGCLKLADEEEAAGNIKTTKTRFICGLLNKDSFKAIEPEIVKVKVEPQSKFIEFRNIFELLGIKKTVSWEVGVTGFENAWLAPFLYFQQDFEKRVQKRKNDHCEFVIEVGNNRKIIDSIEKKLGIYDQPEEEWENIFSEKEQIRQDEFYDSLLEIINNVPVDKINVILADVNPKNYSKELISKFIAAITK